MLRSTEDNELRRYSKRANERLRRLEKWQKEHKSGFTPAYEQAMFYLQNKKEGLVRFKENIDNLSEEEKREQLFKVTAFLTNPLSERKALNRREKIRQKIEKGMEELKEENKGLFNKVGIQKKDETNEKQFWTLFDTAKQLGLVKAFDYKTIAKVLSWKLEDKSSPRVFRKIAEWILTQESFEGISRTQLFRDIGTL